MPSKRKKFLHLFLSRINILSKGEDNQVVERVESIKKDLIDNYVEIKKNQKEELSIVAQDVYPEEKAEKIYEMLEKETGKQIEEIKADLYTSEEYLQSMVDVIGRRENG